MRSTISAFVAIVVLILSPLGSTTPSGPIALAQTLDPPARVGRLSYMTGQVSFAPGGVNQWAPAVLNYPLTTGTALWTDENARAEFHIGVNAIRMSQATEVDLLNLDDESTQLRVPQGTIDISVHQLAAGEWFEVDTPSAAVTLVRPGRYRFDVDPAGQSVRVTVWEGQTDIATSRDTFSVTTGQTVIVMDNRSPPYQIVPTMSVDAFGQWSFSRWRRERQALQVAVQYVPASMTGFEDLAFYGSWRGAGTYGNAWFPSVQPGWAPYRYGRWVYVSPWGWTWVDDAPWGFAPFHYGRWVLIGGRWAWIPGRTTIVPVFAPALVVFVIVPGGGIGWFPLAWQEAYVPPYQTSPTYYRNINMTVVNITVVNVTNVTYVHRHSSQAITVTRQETMVRSQPVGGGIVGTRKSDIANAKVAGAAPSQPSLSSLLGRPGGPAGRRPPAAVQQRPVVVRATPPTPVAPPAAVQQAPVRIAPPMKPAIERRGAPPRQPVQPAGPTQQPSPPAAPGSRPTESRAAPTTPQPAPTPQPVPTPRRPGQRPRAAPTTAAPEPSPAPTPQPVPTPRRGSTPAPTPPPQPTPPATQPVPTPQQPAPTPRPVPTSSPTMQQPVPPTPQVRPTTRAPQGPQGPSTPRPRPTREPNCNPRSRDYDPSRCPTPTPH